MQIHNIFHPNLLRLVAKDPLAGQINDPPPSIVVNNEEKWEVDDILNAKKHGKRVLFQVEWKKYDKDKQWYPSTNFNNVREIVDDFYKRHPTKPKVANWSVTDG